MSSNKSAKKDDKKGNNAKTTRNAVPDPRFAKAKTDPRFKKISSNKSKVVVDDRFKKMFEKEEFQVYSKVDARGKKNEKKKGDELKRFYRMENEDKEDEDEIDEDEEVDEDDDSNEDEEEDEEEVRPSKPKKSNKEKTKKFAWASSDDEDEDDNEEDEDSYQGPVWTPSSSEDEEEPELEEEEEEEVEEIPVGDATNRIAILNCDWDNLKAVDLLVMLQSFVPSGGAVKSVTIYPSDFGLEKLKEEQEKGPAVFKDEDEEEEEENGEQEGETSKEGFDMEKLRKYETDKLKYYFAIAECDTVKTAMSIYEQIDGMEIERSSNVVDARYIPDEMSMKTRQVRDSADSIPTNYKPPSFYTKALQHTKLECSWDINPDKERAELSKGKFTKEQLREMDYKSYIASDSSDSSDEEVAVVPTQNNENKENSQDIENQLEDAMERKKAKIRNKYKALLDMIKPEEQMGEEMEITFTPGLSEKAENLLEKKKEEERRGNETLFEQSIRKKKERKKEQKKLRKKGGKEDEDDSDDNSDDNSHYDDTGRSFDDDDIMDHLDDNREDFDEEEEENIPRKSKKSKKPKNKKNKSVDPEDSKKKAELELMMLSENIVGDNGEEDRLKKKGYNLNTLITQHSGSKRQKKKLEKKGKVVDDFEIDTKDSRFKDLWVNPEYALDPTDKSFKKTAGTDAILKERVKRRAEVLAKQEEDAIKASKGPSNNNKDNGSLKALVDSIKKKSAKNFTPTATSTTTTNNSKSNGNGNNNVKKQKTK